MVNDQSQNHLCIYTGGSRIGDLIFFLSLKPDEGTRQPRRQNKKRTSSWWKSSFIQCIWTLIFNWDTKSIHNILSFIAWCLNHRINASESFISIFYCSTLKQFIYFIVIVFFVHQLIICNNCNIELRTLSQ